MDNKKGTDRGPTATLKRARSFYPFIRFIQRSVGIGIQRNPAPDLRDFRLPLDEIVRVIAEVQPAVPLKQPHLLRENLTFHRGRNVPVDALQLEHRPVKGAWNVADPTDEPSQPPLRIFRPFEI